MIKILANVRSQFPDKLFGLVKRPKTKLGRPSTNGYIIAVYDSHDWEFKPLRASEVRLRSIRVTSVGSNTLVGLYTCCGSSVASRMLLIRDISPWTPNADQYVDIVSQRVQSALMDMGVSYLETLFMVMDDDPHSQI